MVERTLMGQGEISGMGAAPSPSNHYQDLRGMQNSIQPQQTQPELRRELDLLQRSIRDVLNFTALLTERLQPLMRQPCPPPPEAVTKDSDPVSAIGAELRDCSSGLRSVTRDMADLVQRLVV